MRYDLILCVVAGFTIGFTDCTGPEIGYMAIGATWAFCLVALVAYRVDRDSIRGDQC